MSRYSCRIGAVAVLLLALAVTATALPSHHEEGRHQDDAHLLLLGAAKVFNEDEPYKEMKPSGGGADQSSPDGRSSSSGRGEHRKEPGEGSNNKEGEKQPKTCLTREQCHKKKIICGKGCTLSAHSKCAAKCSKSCVPTC